MLDIPSHKIKDWFSEKLILQKMDNPMGYVAVVFLSLLVAYLFSIIGLKYAMVFFGGILGLAVVVASFINLQFGIIVTLFTSIFILLGVKYANLPLGISHDLLLIVMFFRVIVGLIKDPTKTFARSPISILILIWIFYNLIQVINPWAASKLAWLFSVRAIAILMLFYFIACYSFDSYKKISFALKAVLISALIFGLYGLKQEYIGFSTAELNWLYSNEDSFQRIFQWSRLRVFSFCVDPTNFGIMMAYSSTICLILATGPFAIKQRIALVLSAIVMILGMAYAGSRTPIVMIPLGIGFFTLLSFNKRIMAGTLIVFLLGALFMMKSTSNPVIWRIQSAFNLKASADTMNVRMKNQKFIQPYIHTHPFGGGVGSCGEWGARFNPDSMLAGFAHDSAYVRVAVELGWIGLILYMLMLFVIVRTGIYYSLRVRNEKIKYLYMAITTAIFMLIFASYPQEVISQLPNSIVFYILLAALVKLKDFDDPIEAVKEKKPTFRYPKHLKKKKNKISPFKNWVKIK